MGYPLTNGKFRVTNLYMAKGSALGGYEIHTAFMQNMKNKLDKPLQLKRLKFI